MPPKRFGRPPERFGSRPETPGAVLEPPGSPRSGLGAPRSPPSCREPALRSSSRPEASRRLQLVSGVFPPRLFFIFKIFFNNCRVLRWQAFLSKTRVLEETRTQPRPNPRFTDYCPPSAGMFFLITAVLLSKNAPRGAFF